MVSLSRYSLVMALVISFWPCFVEAEPRGALSSLKAFASSPHVSKEETVLGLVGFYGDPGPPQWLILTGSPSEVGVMKESVFRGGKVVAERKFKALIGQDLPTIPIRLESLKFDSTDAFTAAEKIATERKVSFDTVHYQLRCRAEGNEPVWMLSLINPSQVAVGVVYISALNGKVLEESWPALQLEKFASPR